MIEVNRRCKWTVKLDSIDSIKDQAHFYCRLSFRSKMEHSNYIERMDIELNRDVHDLAIYFVLMFVWNVVGSSSAPKPFSRHRLHEKVWQPY